MNLLKTMSIQKKLMISMAFCLVLFLLISSFVSVVLTTRGIRARAVNQELPAIVGEIRNDILRRIGEPLATTQSIANNSYLLDWESQGLSDDGLEAWKHYAALLKSKTGVASVIWASGTTGKYMTEAGLDRTLSPANQSDQWFYGFLKGGKSYVIDLDKDVRSGLFMMFINVRFEAAGGKTGVAGVGVAVDAMATAIKSYTVGNTGSVFLVRPDGSLLIHRDPQLADGKHFLKDLPGFNADLSGQLLAGQKFVSSSFSSPNGTQIVAASFVPELNLYVVAQVPEAEILGNVLQSQIISALIAALIGGGIGLCVIFVVSRAIAGPVARAAGMLGEIASGDGDLTQRMVVESKDEIGALADAFNRFVSSLNKTISEVRKSTDAIANASKEIASGNLDLSSRTENQASSLEETASAMEELTSTVQQNADNAKQANQLVVSASDFAVKGGDVVGQVVQTMGSIKESSGKIVDIIAVIDGIAFQTNILALNAAVEAARAGEQGRGFAVVASEVRSLAQRSAAAAKEIKELISDSVDKVQMGGSLVDQAGAAMEHIVTSVKQVADIMSEIAAASVEQSSGISQVNLAINEMDNATQQNAALVEQAAAAAQAMQEQAANLHRVVGSFKLDSEDAAGRTKSTSRELLVQD